MEPTEQKVHLLIADISGFTRFIWAHRETLAHAQVIINELLRAVLETVEAPLEVAKLEGDAVFLYLPAGDAGARVPAAVDGFFRAFAARQRELYAGNLCHCDSCANIGELRLKVFVHSGSALFYSLGRFQELSGPDVITIHRLTKNSVRGDQYLLATEAAYRSLAFPPDMGFQRAEERYPDIGAVPIHVHYPHLPFNPQQCAKRSWGYRFGREWIKYFRSLPYRFGWKRVTLPDHLGVSGD